MRVPFSELPGARERHLRRKLANPLFPGSPAEADPDALLEAQRLDHEALAAFLDELKELVGEAAALPPNVESDRILGLKERLDRAYETACGVADDQSRNKAAIRRLLEVIMRAVWSGAAGDPQAQQELEQEEQARDMHFALLEHPLVADLLAPDSPIEQQELVPALLSAGADELEAALGLFDGEQLAEITCDARARLSHLDPQGEALPQAWEHLGRMEERRGAGRNRPLHS